MADDPKRWTLVYRASTIAIALIILASCDVQSHDAAISPASATTTSNVELGIIQSTRAYPDGYVNSWRGLVNGQIMRIDAAGERIYEIDSNKNPVPTKRYTGILRYNTNGDDQFYITPIQPGPVKIVAAKGTILTIARVSPDNWLTPVADSETCLFDASSGQFMYSSGTPIPTMPIPPNSN